MKKEGITAFCPKSRQEWREWLHENHRSASSVWLICYKMKSKVPTLSWSEAVDEALCFGWIDSIRKPLDDEKFRQFFCKRKVNGTWSKINKEKIKQLIEADRMTEAGFESIASAQQNGSWTLLDEVEALLLPPDLKKEFDTQAGSEDYFLSLSKSVKKAMLQWLVLAKQPETRRRRISEIVELASQKQKPKQF